VQFLHADGSPKERILTGRKAIAYKNVTLNGARIVFRWPGPVVPRRRHVAVDQPGQRAVRSLSTRTG
jgi:hypothetical protein